MHVIYREEEKEEDEEEEEEVAVLNWKQKQMKKDQIKKTPLMTE